MVPSQVFAAALLLVGVFVSPAFAQRWGPRQAACFLDGDIKGKITLSQSSGKVGELQSVGCQAAPSPSPAPVASVECQTQAPAATPPPTFSVDCQTPVSSYNTASVQTSADTSVPQRPCPVTRHQGSMTIGRAFFVETPRIPEVFELMTTFLHHLQYKNGIQLLTELEVLYHKTSALVSEEYRKRLG